MFGVLVSFLMCVILSGMMYFDEHYKMAMLNAFAGGACFAGIIMNLIL